MKDVFSIFNIKNKEQFQDLALQSFYYQWEYNTVYRDFCNLLQVKPKDIKDIEKIPFLPIQFFKEHKVIASRDKVQTIFTSSGTTGSVTSKHYVTQVALYEKSFRESFKIHYGAITDYTVLALLPSYLDRTGSSLIYMVDALIKDSKNPDSGFYLNELDMLAKKLKDLDQAGKKVLLVGVSFALLDLIEQYTFDLKNTIVMETGGMKGRRKELIREELHTRLSRGFGVSHIHSEYGMTELLSQAYSAGNGIFTTPPWMHISIRDTEDALTNLSTHQNGGINVIDLANMYSCPFIATQDLGSKVNATTFKVLGRFDNADIRGCNLMVL